ncbi:hypothetical protein BGZ79_000817 [Entomortierella chlamydospora]|nr:hypothetical protein BGZ79_000817 [Entomortierella chlamydospora]
MGFLKSPVSKKKGLKRRRCGETSDENNIKNVSTRKHTHIQSHVLSNNTGLERNQSSVHSNGDSTPYNSLDETNLPTNTANDDPVEQCTLGDIYQHGKGEGSQDHFEAAKWYLRAAKQGLAVAQYQLGSMYYDGKGVPQSYQRSLEWYLKAAYQENVDAQRKLGQMYREGKGVAKDDHKAMEWFLKAAKKEDPDAQDSLGDMCYHGNGVPQDYKKRRFGITRQQTKEMLALRIA